MFVVIMMIVVFSSNDTAHKVLQKFNEAELSFAGKQVLLRMSGGDGHVQGDTKDHTAAAVTSASSNNPRLRTVKTPSVYIQQTSRVMSPTSNSTIAALSTNKRTPLIGVLQHNITLANVGQCFLASKNVDTLKQTMARFFFFQKDSGAMLSSVLAYYSQVASVDSLVLIDHEGKDQTTRQILDEYAMHGAHVWKCERFDHNLNPFIFKRKMLSEIILRYREKTSFVFPLDADELLAVIKTDSTSNQKSLHWNKDDFETELKRLLKADEKGRAKLPFKTTHAELMPKECPNQKVDFNRNYYNKVHAPFCDVTQIKLRKIAVCMDKIFMLGKDFNHTDEGNHHGGTSEKNYEVIRDECNKHFKDSGSVMEDMKTIIANIHMGDVDFSSWLIHTLKGAKNLGWTSTLNLQNCTALKQSMHVCYRWNALLSSNFSIDSLTESFTKKNCFVDGMNLLVSTRELTGELCK